MTNATFTLRSPMPVSADELYAWHSRPLAFQRLQPPWEPIELKAAHGSFGTEPYRCDFRTPFLGPFKTTWSAETYDFQPGKQFQDRQLKGPFAFWNHTHRFIADTENTSFLEDHIAYRVPLGGIGNVFGGGMVRQRLAAVFAYRHALTASDLRRHNLYRDRPRLTIAVTGSRGLVGSELVPFLTTGGHRVVRLVTGKGGPPFDDGTRWVNWNPAAPLDPKVLEGVDAVIHLAGDNVASGRWNEEKKRKITESRTVPTRVVADAIAAMPEGSRPKAFVCASAVGFYGNRGDEILTEDSPAGTGFFPAVCKAWESASDPARNAGVRTTNLRIGVVLTPRGGALGKQLPAFKAGVGAVLGSGKQWIPWITIGDLVGVIHHCLMNETISGPVNSCAPEPVTNHEFTKSLGRVLRRPAFFWLPRFMLRVMFGGITDDALLTSLRTVPKKLLDTGFTFDHSELISALKSLLGR
ncbi:MAG: TIGR01777 family oxidoreductase [Planctomycetes bacterium]|nr:TIGR01777 family oxidoreductase [Planctomycetota bacterium]